MTRNPATAWSSTTVTFNTGDDCIAIKSGRDADGRRVNVPSQNVVIQNCNFANGHGGITIGSEMTGGVKNVYARDLTMNSANLQAGHRIKTNTLRGGYALNSNVYRITAGTVGGPLLLIQGNYNAQTGDFPPDIDRHHAGRLDGGQLRGRLVDRRRVGHRPGRHGHPGRPHHHHLDGGQLGPVHLQPGRRDVTVGGMPVTD